MKNVWCTQCTVKGLELIKYSRSDFITTRFSCKSQSFRFTSIRINYLRIKKMQSVLTTWLCTKTVAEPRNYSIRSNIFLKTWTTAKNNCSNCINKKETLLMNISVRTISHKLYCSMSFKIICAGTWRSNEN